MTINLTKRDKTKLTREANIRGMTMAALIKHKFLMHSESDQDVIITSNKDLKYNASFNLSLSQPMKTQFELFALKQQVTVSDVVRDLISA